MFFLEGARQQDFISGGPEIVSSCALKYYPLCGFDCGQAFNKKHIEKQKLIKLTLLDLRREANKDFISGAPEITPSWGLKYYPLLWV